MNRLKELKYFQEKLIKEIPGFPVKKCSLTAKLVFEKFGFPPVSGTVFTIRGLEDHSWNVEENGKIVDLDYYRFDSSELYIVYSDLMDVCQDKGYFVDKELTNNLKKYIPIEKNL